MILFKKKKIVMIESKIGRVWLINNVNWLFKILFIQEVVKKALKKGKNDIIYIYWRHMDETYNKRIISMINNINSDPNKICFFESYINLKTMQNQSKKPISKIITKLGKIHIDFWETFPDISLERNCDI